MAERLWTDGLTKRYRSKEVVSSVSIQVKRGEVVGLLGPNGAGKTTTFYMLVGLVRADAGRIWLDREEINRMPVHVRARRGIGYLPQESSVFRGLTVEQNILAILETLHIGRRERRERLRKLLGELDIAHLAKQKAFTLSGGERRRVEITRALVTSPSFLLLDEPFTGVDPIALADIQQIISQLRSKGYGVLITDHNVRETLSITDRGYILDGGKVRFSGTPQELAGNEEARRIYLGEGFRL